MLRNYLKIAYRSLTKNRLVSFINIFGLGLSMSVGMMEMIIVQTNLEYDRFHPYPERTYRVTSAYTQKDGKQWKLASTPLPLYGALAADTGMVESAVNIYPAIDGTASTDAKELSIKGAFTEPSFFNVFGFSLAAGNAATALAQPNTMVVSKAMAARFFGTANPLGKVLNLQKRGQFVITGVLNEPPGKSHISFDLYVSAASIPYLEKNKLLAARSESRGDYQAAYTYVLLKKGTGEKVLAGELNAMAADINRYDKNGQATFALQPIEKVRPAPDNLYNDIGSGTTWTKLWVGIDVSLIILLAACFNYTNLTIARALTRAKEVGVRKIVGAERYQLFAQYVVESLVMAFCALAFAWVLLSFIIYYAPFNDGYEMIPSSWKYNAPYILCTAGFAAFTGLLAGIAPAWILSAFKPLRVLKNLSTAKLFGKVGLQKSLIVFQYSLSLVIIIFLVTFYRQFSFMGSRDPGFKRDQVMVVPLGAANAAIAAQQMATVSGVQTVAGLSTTFNGHFQGQRSGAWVDKQQEALPLNYFFTDPSFIPAMKLGLLAGRNFDATADTSMEREIILNGRAALGLGFKTYEAALGKRVWVNDTLALGVVGVVTDFNYENAGKPVDPMAFRNKKSFAKYLFIGVGNGDKEAITARMAESWKGWCRGRYLCRRGWMMILRTTIRKRPRCRYWATWRLWR